MTPDIMGTVAIFADYGVPVGKVRAELDRVCKASPRWDGKVRGLQVAGVTAQTPLKTSARSAMVLASAVAIDALARSAGIQGASGGGPA